MENSIQSGNGEQEHKQEFLTLYLPNIRRIYGFISCMVPNWSDVDDIFQQATSIMWAKFDGYKPGSNFVAWALKITQYEIMAYHRKKNDRRLCFDETLIGQMANMVQSSLYEFDQRKRALKICLDKLREKDRQILHFRYERNLKPKILADRIGCSVEAIYKLLNRIHHKLLLCIRYRLTLEEHP
ncbi:MAG: sigma-70 family RNA polymerase sigma factor [Sedimentisphaerales bacterium]|nr:sigma-70 family RNA polymerase sigma factor [Sedimentisphaerales bacterium]